MREQVLPRKRAHAWHEETEPGWTAAITPRSRLRQVPRADRKCRGSGPSFGTRRLLECTSASQIPLGLADIRERGEPVLIRFQRRGRSLVGRRQQRRGRSLLGQSNFGIVVGLPDLAYRLLLRMLELVLRPQNDKHDQRRFGGGHFRWPLMRSLSLAANSPRPG